MLAVSLREPVRHFPRMAAARDDRGEAKVWGAALAQLREDRGMSQEEAAEAAGFQSFQAWQRYELGAPGIFRPATQEKLTRAVGASVEDLARVVAVMNGGERASTASQFAEMGRTFEVRIDGRGRAGVAAPQMDDLAGAPHFRDMSWLFDSTTRYLVVATESMIGYVDPGMTVSYDISQKPRRGDGCVIELHTGERFVKEYVGTDHFSVNARQRFPEEELKYPAAQVRGVYKIKARFD